MRRIAWTLAISVVSGITGCGGDGGAIDASLPPDAPAEPDAPGPIADAAPPDAAEFFCDETLPYPIDLRCTGMYADFEARTIADGVREFKPGFQLWSDGAEKTRWIYLPPGTTIDVSDPYEWTFPVGTKLFKEFRIDVPGVGVRPVETRMLWKTGDAQWVRRTYVWNDDMTAAPEESDGVTDVHGTTYDIPRQIDCIRCHGGRVDNVLGFENVLLAAPEATGVTYQVLLDEALLSGPFVPELADLQIPGSAVERNALGYLHANCGVSCHNPNIGGSRFDMRLQHDTLTDVTATQAFQQAINQESTFQPPGATELYYRIRPTDPARSAIQFRMNVRDGEGATPQQMPPVATDLVDAAGVAAVQAWIEAMIADPYPAPAP